MKPLQPVILLVSLLSGLASLSTQAQITVFDDNFATDASDPSSSYLSANTVTGTADDWTWANGMGITLDPNASGKLSDLVGSFSAVTLANAGDYISFVVNFNSPDINQSGSSAAGAMLFALDNSEGTSLFSGLTGPPWVENNGSTSTGGPTDGYLGYLGQMQMQSSAKSSTKFYAKTAAGNNNLSYYSNVNNKSAQFTQTGTGNANLAANDLYTLTYTITALNAGATQMQINASIYDNTLGSMVDNLTVVATNGVTYITPTSKFDTFDVGVYTGTESSYNVNLSEVSVLTNVPEPAGIALAGLGLTSLILRLRRR